ncbi:GAF domain-containing protein [Microscilla marina]|uniref:Two-component hybrid sensor and regulator, putative n=1 Tax=Microscilla marina ATCC 23134 TaxID=313606 RepID=A1ZLR3_MICM2|nr:GAF domain-containing protein [Microscilla marina]EAY28817.1 two-component hybrid sensor and regulator, putative [Microscilla marina ATCC 23134]
MLKRIKNIQNLSIRLKLTLFVIFLTGIITGNFLYVQYYNNSLIEISEKTINIAGKNGALSQQIALYALEIKNRRDNLPELKTKLKQAVDKHNSYLMALEKGGYVDVDNEQVHIDKPAPKAVQITLGVVKETWKLYKKNAEVVANLKTIDDKTQTLNSNVRKAIEYLLENSSDMYEKDSKLVQADLRYFTDKHDKRRNILIALFSANIVLLFLGYLYIDYVVIGPVSKIAKIDDIISEGDFEQRVPYKREDELGKVAHAINTLFENLQNATDFITAIGEGKLDVEYQLSVDNGLQRADRLTGALLEMRDKMSQVAESDRQRNWISEGLAKFANILREDKDRAVEEFTYDIIANLVKYTNANQGGLFIVNDRQGDSPYLELLSSYAFEKRKYVDKVIHKGEGLVGEVFQEGSTVYITDVPNDYVNITSGLGDSNPRCILIVPLKLNDEIFGVVELASFYQFQPFQIDFVEKLGESIASTFASIKTSKRTEQLLLESVQLGEQMKTQEEEMRQNLEELVATQNEVERQNQKITKQKTELEKALEDEKRKRESVEKREETLRKNLEELKQAQREMDMKTVVYQRHRDAIWLIENNLIIDCNDAALRMFGVKDKVDMIDRMPDSYSPNEQADGQRSSELLKAHVKKTLDTGATIFEWQYETIQGETINAEVQMNAFDLGKKRMIMVVNRNVNLLKSQELELKNKADELRKAERDLQKSIDQLVVTQEKLRTKDQEVEEIKLQEEEKAKEIRESQKKLLHNMLAKSKRAEMDLKRELVKREASIEAYKQRLTQLQNGGKRRRRKK